jgi:hypothetical protein
LTGFSLVSVGSQTPVTYTPSPDYSGTWYGSYGGYSFTYEVIQSGNNLTITRSLDGLISTAVLNGNTAIVTTNNEAGSGSSTLTVLSDTTVRAVVNSCVPNYGYICVVPNGVEIILTRA